MENGFRLSSDNLIDFFKPQTIILKNVGHINLIRYIFISTAACRLSNGRIPKVYKANECGLSAIMLVSLREE